MNRGRPARKRFGQHFLEPAWVEKVVRAIDPQPDQTFIEIGPGRGALTRPLAARAHAVVAYEIDRDLARDLRATAPPNVTVVEGDFLETFAAHPAPVSAPGTQHAAPGTQHAALGTQHAAPGTQHAAPGTQHAAPGTQHAALGTQHGAPSTQHQALGTQRSAPSTQHQALGTLRWPPARIAGNLPYNVASPIMFRLVEAFLAGAPLADATLMLQLEVAERLVAKPGTKAYGVLTVLIGHCADVQLVLKLPPGAFRPVPKVRSAVVRLRFHPPDPPVRDRRRFEALVQAVFTRRRKTLANALRALPGTAPGLGTDTLAGIALTRRPETLTMAEFAALADVFSSP